MYSVRGQTVERARFDDANGVAHAVLSCQPLVVDSKRMNEMRRTLRQVVALGANRVLREAGFKRPGGGWRFVRQRGPVEQTVAVSGTWSGPAGRVRFRLAQSVDGQEVWSPGAPRSFVVHLVHSEQEDVAIDVAHWLTTKALPLLTPELHPDLLALAPDGEGQTALCVACRANAMRSAIRNAAGRALARAPSLPCIMCPAS